MGAGDILICAVAGYYCGALLTGYICGRWGWNEFTTTNNCFLWPFALPIIGIMWAHSKGKRR